MVLALPKTLIARIAFTPSLPAAYDQYLQRQPMGSVVKVNAIYDTPFWRDQGLSGTATSDTGPIQITYDNSPPDGAPGVLVGFMEGNQSRRLLGASDAPRRKAALDCFARYFGPDALRPTGYVDQVWARETYTRGAYGSFNPPGVLTALGAAVAGPVGRLHFAGADYSAEWPGYMDGAIRSGERAAAGGARRALSGYEPGGGSYEPWKIEKSAPCGSSRTTNRPAGTSVGPISTWPPSSSALAALPSRSSTPK